MLPSVQEGGGGGWRIRYQRKTSFVKITYQMYVVKICSLSLFKQTGNKGQNRHLTVVSYIVFPKCFFFKTSLFILFFEKVHCCTLSAPFWYICDHRNSAICCHRAGGAGPQAGRVNAHHSSLQCSIEILKRCSSSGETTPLAEPSLSPL